MTKTYEVIGSRKVCGHTKGERFQADFTAAEELRKLEGGQLGLVPDAPRRQSPPTHKHTEAVADDAAASDDQKEQQT